MTESKVISPVSEIDVRWMEELQAQIWGSQPLGRSDRRGHWDSRELTTPEWERVKTLLTDHELPVELSSDGLGHLCILVYRHPEAPGVPPAPWFSLRMDHLPGIKAQQGYEKRFSRGWDEFSPFTHSDRNRQLLELYGLRPVKQPGRYVY